MGNRLSHTAINKFKYCPTAWKFYYIDKYRPIKTGSALLFGNALGKALEPEKALPDVTARELFSQLWAKQKINGVEEDLATSTNVEYLKSDTDKDLGKTPWEALRAKGMLMLTAFEKHILPYITHLHSTEEYVELRSGDDVSVGFADAVVNIQGYQKPIILDFKTASRKYEEDSVQKSEQLSQYLHSLADKYNTRTCGYVVFSKQIRKNRTKICTLCGYNASGTRYSTCPSEIEGKRCSGEFNETINPECDVQIIIDEIPEEFELTVIDEIGTINDKINAGKIYQNLEACENNYGKPCEFYNICHKGTTEGLIQQKEKTDNVVK
jgi:hypothetical protein